MEEQLQLKASKREEKAKQNQDLRKSGYVPAVLYGKDTENKNLKVEINALEKIYSQAKESTLIDLTIDDEKAIKVLIHDMQKHEVNDNLMHVDFYQVNMDEKINAEINLIFTGIAPAVKEHGGTLVRSKDVIEVKCFPNDLIKELEIDISSLKTFEDVIRVKDLNMPDKLELVTEEGITVAKVAAPRSEEELESLSEKVEENVDKVEAAKGEKEKEDEKAEDAKEKPEEKKEDKK